MHDGSFTEATGSTDAGDRPGSQAGQTIAATAPTGVVPLALLVSSVILLAIGPRHDLGLLGPLLAWGASAAQFVLAMVLVWIAAHESTPAGRLPRQMVYFAAVAGSLVVVFVTLLTFSTSPANERLLRVPPRVNEMLRDCRYP